MSFRIFILQLPGSERLLIAGTLEGFYILRQSISSYLVLVSQVTLSV